VVHTKIIKVGRRAMHWHQSTGKTITPTLPGLTSGLPGVGEGLSRPELLSGGCSGAIRVQCMGQEDTDAKQREQCCNYINRHRLPPRRAMPGTALLRNSR